METSKKELPSKQRDELLAALKARCDANKALHLGLVWAKVKASGNSLYRRAGIAATLAVGFDHGNFIGYF